MTITTVETGHQGYQETQPKSETKSKSRFRPKSLLLADPRELGRRLSTVMGSDDKKRDEEKDRMSDERNDDDSASTVSLWKEDYIIEHSHSSPKTAGLSVKSKHSHGLNPTSHLHWSPHLLPQSNSSSSSRRSSLFGHFSFKGSNYDPKGDDDAAPRSPRYKHVPSCAASQFAKTTTVEPLTEQKVIDKQMLSSPSMVKGTMSAEEYHRRHRRTQSLSSAGRMYERSNSLFPPVLESTAECDEEPRMSKPRHSLQPHHIQGLNMSRDFTRRISAGNIQAKAGVQRTADIPPSPRYSSFQGERHGSFTSSATGEPTPPFRQDSDSWEGSESGSNASRRGSLIPQRLATADVYKVDWSQSNEVRMREERWSTTRGRVGTKSDSNPGVDELHKSPLPKFALRSKLKG